MDDYALVLNAGSSSLKFCVYWRSELENWHLESRGQIEGVGISPRISARDAEGGILIDQKLDASVCDGFNALETLAAWLSFMYGDGQLVGVGHRVVHGGTRYAHPTVVTPEVLAELYRLVPLAPLHQPYNLAAIEAVSKRFPMYPKLRTSTQVFTGAKLALRK
jgi:acetate kinase